MVITVASERNSFQSRVRRWARSPFAEADGARIAHVSDVDDVDAARDELGFQTPFSFASQTEDDSGRDGSKQAGGELGARDAAGDSRNFDEQDVGVDRLDESLEGENERETEPRRVETADRFRAIAPQASASEAPHRDRARWPDERQGKIAGSEGGGDAPSIRARSGDRRRATAGRDSPPHE